MVCPECLGSNWSRDSDGPCANTFHSAAPALPIHEAVPAATQPPSGSVPFTRWNPRTPSSDCTAPALPVCGCGKPVHHSGWQTCQSAGLNVYPGHTLPEVASDEEFVKQKWPNAYCESPVFGRGFCIWQGRQREGWFNGLSEGSTELEAWANAAANMRETEAALPEVAQRGDKWSDVCDQCSKFLLNPGEPSTKPIEWCIQLIEELRDLQTAVAGEQRGETPHMPAPTREEAIKVYAAWAGVSEEFLGKMANSNPDRTGWNASVLMTERALAAEAELSRLTSSPKEEQGGWMDCKQELPPIPADVMDQVRDAHKYCNGGLEGTRIVLSERERQLHETLAQVQSLNAAMSKIILWCPRGWSLELDLAMTAGRKLLPTPPDSRKESADAKI